MEEFEDRLQGLLKGDGADSRGLGVSAASVIGGAKRRRTRHRTAVAGSSLAVLAVAAGVGVAFGGGAGSPAAAQRINAGGGAKTSAAPSATGPVECAAPTSKPSAKAPEGGNLVAKFAKAVGNTYPLASGVTDGHAWSVTVGFIPSGKAFQAAHPDLEPAADDYLFPDTPAAWTFLTIDGVPTAAGREDLSQSLGDAKNPGILSNGGSFLLGERNCHGQWPATLYHGKVSQETDHLQVAYAGHSDRIPVVAVGGYKFVVMSVKVTDPAKTITAYDASGHEIGHQSASPYLDALPPTPTAFGTTSLSVTKK